LQTLYGCYMVDVARSKVQATRSALYVAVLAPERFFTPVMRGSDNLLNV